MNDAPAPPPNPEPTSPSTHYAPPSRAPKRSLFSRFLSVIGCLAFIFSIVLNLSLLAALGMQDLSVTGMRTEVLADGQKEQTVAVYRVDGVIDSDATRNFNRFCNSVKNDSDVQAVVIYVNSPGGTVSDSEQIHRRIGELKSKGKTVVVSMGGLAASGGYYISAGADEIFAEPATITGSIGVITGVLNLEGTLEKVGMKVTLLKSSHAEGWKDMLSSFREPEEREKKYVVSLLNDMQERFERIVRDGRGKKLKTREETYPMRVGEGEDAQEVTRKETAPFNGKVYIAATAKEYGLIDQIGFLDNAYERAAELADLSSPRVVEYRRRPGFFEEAFGGILGPKIQIDARSLQHAQTPQFMMMWKPEW